MRHSTTTDRRPLAKGAANTPQGFGPEIRICAAFLYVVEQGESKRDANGDEEDVPQARHCTAAAAAAQKLSGMILPTSDVKRNRPHAMIKPI
jgi:hypothetical protein